MPGIRATATERNMVVPGAGGEGDGEFVFDGTEFHFGMMKTFWGWIMGMDAQRCECT